MARSKVRQLTTAYRAAQVKKAAIVAALVAAYYRQNVDPENSASVDRWLELWMPRVLGESESTGVMAAKYGTAMRRLEAPGAPEFRFEPSIGTVPEQVRTSLLVVGPKDHFKKISQIRTLERVTPTQERALLRDAREEASRKIAASTLRHVQNGGRQTLVDNAAVDPVAIGWIRVTRGKPCFFCAMLASRGLNGGLYSEDSFEASDPRFVGEGTVKVHDECQCTMKPAYSREDEFLADIAPFEDMWSRWGAGGGDSMLRFRRGYEHWAKTGEFLDEETVSSAEAFRGRFAS